MRWANRRLIKKSRTTPAATKMLAAKASLILKG